MNYTIENETIKATISSYGAELISLVNKASGAEYMWCGDKAYWGRVSPVLFPFVGKVAGGRYVHEGIEYEMGQHGFARDMEFELIRRDENVIAFELKSNEETLKKYPFEFSLVITYEVLIREKSGKPELKVEWTVTNTGAKDMHFSIGAHPAFNCPPLGSDYSQPECSLKFDKKDGIVYGLLNDDGLLEMDCNYITLDNGLLPIDAHLFDNDALIIENNQTHAIALADNSGRSYVTVLFDAPLVGVWSPAGKCAPFVCIEPWYGRADRFDFTGELREREWGNALASGEKFDAGYEILL